MILFGQVVNFYMYVRIEVLRTPTTNGLICLAVSRPTLLRSKICWQCWWQVRCCPCRQWRRWHFPHCHADEVADHDDFTSTLASRQGGWKNCSRSVWLFNCQFWRAQPYCTKWWLHKSDLFRLEDKHEQPLICELDSLHREAAIHFIDTMMRKPARL